MTADPNARAAYEAASAIAAREPGDPGAAARAGDLAQAAGLPDAARTHYAQAIARYQLIPAGAPQHRESRLHLGELLVRLDRVDEAIAVLSDAAASSGDPRFAFLLGRVLRARRDFAAAATWYDRAASLAPSAATVLAELGEVRMEQGKFRAAVPHLSEAARLDPANPAISFHLALALVKSGDLPRGRGDGPRARADSR